MVYGISGSRRVPMACIPALYTMYGDMAGITGASSGCANGVDTNFAEWMWKTYGPSIHHTLVVPNGHHNVNVVRWFELRQRAHPDAITIVRMGKGTTFKDRNYEIVNQCDRLAAAPLSTEYKSPRSGTWQTIRHARASAKLWRVLILETAMED